MAVNRVALSGSGSAMSRSPITVRDRKSTRLNSSHLVISYAVFCLKKKELAYVAADHRHDVNAPTQIAAVACLVCATPQLLPPACLGTVAVARPGQAAEPDDPADRR